MNRLVTCSHNASLIPVPPDSRRFHPLRRLVLQLPFLHLPRLMQYRYCSIQEQGQTVLLQIPRRFVLLNCRWSRLRFAHRKKPIRFPRRNRRFHPRLVLTRLVERVRLFHRRAPRPLLRTLPLQDPQFRSEPGKRVRNQLRPRALLLLQPLWQSHRLPWLGPWFPR